MFLAVALVAPSIANAQALAVDPVRIDLSQGRRSATIELTNNGSESTTLQLRVFGWSQANGGDNLAPTDDVAVSPPFVTINPGEHQTVRLVMRAPITAPEQTYRMLVDQLPPPAHPGVIKVAWRIGIPIFATAAIRGPAQLHWHVERDKNGALLLKVRNAGLSHERIDALELISRSGSASVPGFSFRYVLAGSEIGIPITVSDANPGSTLHFVAATERGKVEFDEPLPPRL